MCVIISKSIGGSKILAKNRDRPYKPILEIVHTVLNGVEVVYLHDVITDWSEGMNELGIGIVNTALSVRYDEYENLIIKKGGKPSKDGEKIRRALSENTFIKCLNTTINYNGGINGHSFIATPNKTISIERTSKHLPKFKIHTPTDDVVRTNHGDYYKTAGYFDGPDYISSKIRKSTTERLIKNATHVDQILPILRSKNYDYDSNLNILRDTNKMFTSSQLLLDLTNKIFKLMYRPNKIQKYIGIQQRLPIGYIPKITVVATPIKS